MPAQLPTRKLGNDQVTAIGWGAMGLSAFYGTPQPDEERFKVRNFQSVLHATTLKRCYVLYSCLTLSTKGAAPSGTVPMYMAIVRSSSAPGTYSRLLPAQIPS